MAKKHKKRKSVGTPPGSVVFTGNRKMEVPHLIHLSYTSDSIQEASIESDQLGVTDDERNHWYDFRGLHDENLIDHTGKLFGVSKLILEDVVNVHQRPKFEEFSTGFFIVLKSFSIEKEKGGLHFPSQQVAIYCGKSLVLSFHETPDDLFQLVRTRLHHATGRIRDRGSGFLAYTLIDTIVDHYYLLTDQIEFALEELEEVITTRTEENIKSRLHECRSAVLSLRRDIKPLQEALFQFQKSESPYKEPDIQPYLSDLSGHVNQIVESLDSDLELLNGLQDLYLSELSYKMNRVIQTLTLVATLFIPLTFLTGLYGMNFHNMPELRWEYGYFYFLGFVSLLSLLMLWYFKRKRWL